MGTNSRKNSHGETDLIWGIDGISQAIGQSFAATAYMLGKKQLPAKKVGERWVVSRKKLDEFFTGDAA
jgi:hypothetical protein